MPKKYILQHDTPKFPKDTIFFYNHGVLCASLHESPEFFESEIQDFSYWFSPVVEESPEEIIARLTKENEELKAMFRHKVTKVKYKRVLDDSHDNNSC